MSTQGKTGCISMSFVNGQTEGELDMLTKTKNHSVSMSFVNGQIEDEPDLSTH